ncbi:hypothetical protein [Thiorhodococcus fuscus]|uniref:DUF2750 domain-containing protein n=1 Tax=Thiorhodococcus fuscus TaxID=527200 RepID=A0ABW4Y7J4_9GAMM
MIRIERPSELVRVRESSIREWLEARMVELFKEDFQVTFWVLEAGDAVLDACWTACWGQSPPKEATIEELMDVVEYVESRPDLFAAVVPANHESDLVLVVPQSLVLDPVLRARLTAASLN